MMLPYKLLSQFQSVSGKSEVKYLCGVRKILCREKRKLKDVNEDIILGYVSEKVSTSLLLLLRTIQLCIVIFFEN